MARAFCDRPRNAARQRDMATYQLGGHHRRREYRLISDVTCNPTVHEGFRIIYPFAQKERFDAHKRQEIQQSGMEETKEGVDIYLTVRIAIEQQLCSKPVLFHGLDRKVSRIGTEHERPI